MIRPKQLLIQLLLLLTVTAIGYEGLAWKAAAQYRPVVTLSTLDGKPALAWNAFPLPCYYAIDVLSCQPDSDKPALEWQIIGSFQTRESQFQATASYPFQTFWRVSARSVLQAPLGAFSQAQILSEPVQAAASPATRPKPLSLYPAAMPAPLKPFLTWTSVAGAVYYELELLSEPPATADAASSHRLFVTREVFANGYHADLSQQANRPLYWRVRGLDYDGNPIGLFSEASPIYIDPTRNEPLKPLPTAHYNENKQPTPLYPVYYWIPLAGAAAYEVEVTNRPPENPGGISPSAYRIWSKQATGYGIYDDTARSQPGTYYWRVRALDAQGGALGIYSDAVPFQVDLAAGNYAASFGDSITHGGGAVSYSPADWEYSYQTYLNFPQVNLGKSGDTSATMLERFERDVLPFQPRYLLILGGTNSLRGGTPATQVIADLIAIREKCLRYGIRPIFLTLPPVNPIAIENVFQETTVPNWRTEFDLVNAFIRQQSYHIDLEPHFLDDNRELPARFAVDGLHIDIEGKRLMGNVINHFWKTVANDIK
jgi:lysophospholipase L1-like esterase